MTAFLLLVSTSYSNEENGEVKKRENGKSKQRRDDNKIFINLKGTKFVSDIIFFLGSNNKREKGEKNMRKKGEKMKTTLKDGHR